MDLIKRQIIGTKETSHILTSEDEGYTTMGAYITDISGEEKRVAWVDIEVRPRSTPQPTVVENIGSFPAGTSTDNLVLIYHENNNYVANLDESELNGYARNYLLSIGEIKENDPSVPYFYKEQDEKGNTIGIYTTLKLPDGSPKYGNSDYDENKNIIKVYVKGTAEIIGYKYGDPPKEGVVQEETEGEKTSQDDYGIQLSPGYCCVIGNVIYMFISIRACLVNITPGERGFYYRGEKNTDYKAFSNFNEPLKSNGYYLHKGVVCKNLEIKAPADISIKDDGNFNDVVPTIFDSTEIKSFTTAETMTEIEYFANIANAAKVTLLGIKKIGDYSFAGSNVSGDVLSQAGNLEEIGKYAFAKTPNLNFNSNNEESITVFPPNLKRIGAHAFANSDGTKSIDLTPCSHLEYVGEQAFERCGNLHAVLFLEKQIAHNEATTDLLYLPPDRGDGNKYVPRTKNSVFNTIDFEHNGNVITTKYVYNYDSNQSQEYTISDYEKQQGVKKKTFDQDSNIAWGCTD